MTELQKKHLMRSVFGIVIISLLAGCTNILKYNYSGEREDRLMALALGDSGYSPRLITLELSPEIRLALDERIDSKWGDRKKLRAVRNFLYSDEERDIRYDAFSTKTAIDTYNSRKGNCLALTGLFIASARHVGLDAHYRTIEVKPTWDHSKGTMIRYEHIVASGKIYTARYIVDFLPEFYLGEQAGQRISDSSALALFYNNLGAEHILNGNSELAVAEFRKALAISPGHSDTWNNLGAAFNRLGKSELAEFGYHRALYEDSINYSALSNLARLYRVQNRDEEVAKIRSRVDHYRRKNPYFFYFNALTMFENERYEDVIVLLKRSIRLKKDEPDFYEALAKTYGRLGDEKARREQLALAEKFRSHWRNRYYPDERVLNNRMIVIKNQVSRIRK